MKTKILSFMFVMLITTLSSCKKDEVAPSNPELIKSKPWISTQIAVRAIGLESQPYAFIGIKLDFKDESKVDIYYQDELKKSTSYSFYSDNTKLKFDEVTALSISNFEFNFTELTVNKLTEDELVIVGTLQEEIIKKEFVLYFKH